MNPIRYNDDLVPAPAQFIDVLRRSTLGERRPVDDLDRIESMLAHANLFVTAWSGETLIGVARALTDFSYCCYLSDLAVDAAWQRRGVGKELIRRVRLRLHPEARVILLAAPRAVDYYPAIGFTAHPSAWVMPAG